MHSIFCEHTVQSSLLLEMELTHITYSTNPDKTCMHASIHPFNSFINMDIYNLLVGILDTIGSVFFETTEIFIRIRRRVHIPTIPGKEQGHHLRHLIVLDIYVLIGLD
jgi:hypothetical protein